MACDYTPISMTKIKIPIPNAVEKWFYSCIYSADTKWYSLSGNTLTVSSQLTTWPSNCTLGPLSQRNENSCSHIYLYMNVHSSCIFRTQIGNHTECYCEKMQGKIKAEAIQIIYCYSSIKTNKETKTCRWEWGLTPAISSI